MSFLVAETIETYATQYCPEESPLLQELARETYATMEHPQMQVGRLEGGFLRLLVRLARAQRVLEIGTFTGYSALAMAEGLPEGGALITCDIDARAAAIAQRYFDQSPHGKKITLRLGPALETITKFKGLFDLAFIDADKANYHNYWEAVLPKIRAGGLLVVDNVLWSGRVLDPQDDDSRAIAAFNEFVRNDARVESALLPVRDGITLAWKRG